ncbi:MAG: CRISPR-associated helicase Cas3' [Planctomycetota bacterium]
MTAYARGTPTSPREEWQALRDHLRAVAERAQSLAGVFGAGDQTYLAGILHDLGKYRVEFQEYLAGQRAGGLDTAHAVYGAAVAWHRLGRPDLALAIAGHHASLHDLADLQERVSRADLATGESWRPLLAKLEAELGPIAAPLNPEAQDDERTRRRYEFLTRMLFSALVDADRLDAERWTNRRQTKADWERPVVRLDAAELLRLLNEARAAKATAGRHEHLNKLRNRVFDSCLHLGDSAPQGIFTLTVPTGGGKTLASMAFALSHARRHGLRRVIVVLPYLSIIEQNAQVYRSIFGSDCVLEHHSAVTLQETSDGEHPSSEMASRAAQAVENWDAPIIVTTSVQFLETLFAASPGRARKLHNVARSCVIFDEVQTLPTHMLDPTLDVLRELRTGFKVSFVLCTATQPAFRRTARLPSGLDPTEVLEIAPDPTRLFGELRRVRFHVVPPEERWTWRDLAERMLRSPQALCVLNLRRQAAAAWRALATLLDDTISSACPREALFHLSSAMCPAHRLGVLGLSDNAPVNNIKARLARREPCWVVSTQVVEAGVDIDFPVVFRARGPLDSVVQAAGRCNREGLLVDRHGQPCPGDVTIFTPEDEGLPPGVYRQATQITPPYLDPEKLVGDPSLFAQYFTELYGITATDHARCNDNTIQEDRAKFNFRRVAERARVIRDEGVPVVAPYGPAPRFIEAIRRVRFVDRRGLRRLQTYMVNLRVGPGSVFEKLREVGYLEKILPDGPELYFVAAKCYDPDLGVVVEGYSPEDLIA